jgi:hypothetical protein
MYMLLGLHSCSHLFKKINLKLVKHNGHDVEELLLPHVLEYERVCNRTVAIDIYFEKFNNNTVGVCRGFLMPRNWREISIDLEYYSQSSYADIEALVFHELGHCDLNRLHDNEILNEESIMLSRPKSLMHRYTFSDWTYKWNRDEYIKELCHPDSLHQVHEKTFLIPFDRRTNL